MSTREDHGSAPIAIGVITQLTITNHRKLNDSHTFSSQMVLQSGWRRYYVHISLWMMDYLILSLSPCSTYDSGKPLPNARNNWNCKPLSLFTGAQKASPSLQTLLSHLFLWLRPSCSLHIRFQENSLRFVRAHTHTHTRIVFLYSMPTKCIFFPSLKGLAAKDK